MHRLLVSGLLVLFLVMPIVLSPMSVSADMYIITATACFPELYSSFTLTYNDNDNDTPVPRFGPQEGDTVVAFSGFDASSKGLHLTSIVEAPEASIDYDPYDGVGVYGYPGSWEFATAAGDDLAVASWFWGYTQAAVPLPASALLLGSGLIPLAWWNRRNRLGK